MQEDGRGWHRPFYSRVRIGTCLGWQSVLHRQWPLSSYAKRCRIRLNSISVTEMHGGQQRELAKRCKGQLRQVEEGEGIGRGWERIKNYKTTYGFPGLPHSLMKTYFLLSFSPLRLLFASFTLYLSLTIFSSYISKTTSTVNILFFLHCKKPRTWSVSVSAIYRQLKTSLYFEKLLILPFSR